MPISDPVVTPLAQELLDCFDIEIHKVASPPLHVQLRPGTSVAAFLSESRDECCEGLAWVRVDTFFPSSDRFPEQDDAPVPKGTNAWAIVLELGSYRCPPTPEANEIPSDDQWQIAHEQIMDDAAAMRRAICCFIDAKAGRNRNVLVGSWNPVDIQGGCAGGTMTVTVRGPACDCADAGPVS